MSLLLEATIDGRPDAFLYTCLLVAVEHAIEFARDSSLQDVGAAAVCRWSRCEGEGRLKRWTCDQSGRVLWLWAYTTDGPALPNPTPPTINKARETAGAPLPDHACYFRRGDDRGWRCISCGVDIATWLR